MYLDMKKVSTDSEYLRTNICGKILIFSSKIVQETIQYAQEMSQETQETCHRVQESTLGYKLM